MALVKFRKRFNAKRLAHINEIVLAAEAAEKAAQQAAKSQDDDDDKNDGNGNDGNDNVESPTPKAKCPKETPNQGTLLVDATCTPADVHFPTDLGLLNEAGKN